MSDSAELRRRSVTRLTDPVALRALAHPVRLSLVGLLRVEGPLTATRAAELLGESSGTCSFHLRQLAKYGLVEEAGGGHGREKPWRATAMFTDWPDVAATPALAAATGLLSSVVVERWFGELMRWLEVKADEPAEWQSAAVFGDTLLYVTADELAELGRQERQLVDRFLDRQARPELIPPGARLVTYLHLAYPQDAPAAGAGGGRRDPEGGLNPDAGQDRAGGRNPEGRPDPGGAR
ncbi:MAG: helix-turn-helix transcriptional regulator [Actinobacteria bacterium]|nr:helix-turn-helix transcriptional regulator [Actinomycetota bacterium]